MKTIKTTLFACITLVLISFSAHSQDKGVTLEFKNYDANMALLQNYVAAMNEGNAKKLNSFFADDAIIVGLSGINDTISKKQHLDRYTANFKENDLMISRDIYLSVKTDENAAVTPGEYCFSWGNVSSTNKATKKSANSDYHVVAMVVNGKFTFFMHYYDTMPFALRDGSTLVAPKK